MGLLPCSALREWVILSFELPLTPSSIIFTSKYSFSCICICWSPFLYDPPSLCACYLSQLLLSSSLCFNTFRLPSTQCQPVYETSRSRTRLYSCFDASTLIFTLSRKCLFSLMRQGRFLLVQVRFDAYAFVLIRTCLFSCMHFFPHFRLRVASTAIIICWCSCSFSR